MIFRSPSAYRKYITAYIFYLTVPISILPLEIVSPSVVEHRYSFASQNYNVCAYRWYTPHISLFLASPLTYVVISPILFFSLFFAELWSYYWEVFFLIVSHLSIYFLQYLTDPLFIRVLIFFLGIKLLPIHVLHISINRLLIS